MALPADPIEQQWHLCLRYMEQRHVTMSDKLMCTQDAMSKDCPSTQMYQYEMCIRSGRIKKSTSERCWRRPATEARAAAADADGIAEEAGEGAEGGPR